MNAERKNQTADLGESELRRLLETAGPRPGVPPAELAAIKAAAREDWRRLVDRRAEGGRVIGRGRWRTVAPLAFAATLLVALSIGWWWRSLQGPGESGMVATVELAEGASRVDGSALAVGGELAKGTEIQTTSDEEATVRVALRLSGGQSVRLDTRSRMRLVSDSVLELQNGAVYIDSVAASSLEVRTALGSVREIGTQFEVRLPEGDTNLRVRVREGSVEIERGEDKHSAVAGEELTVGADGSLDRRPLAPWHGDWDWVVVAAPGLQIEDPTLAEYLEWLSRETGWRVRFADEALAASAAEFHVRGTIAGLSPSESVHVVVPASGFEYRLEEGLLLIEP